ncbi:MAG TPA: GNAT family N-acetyltransferase [Pyrinomonadaceae bacterium]|nr:GNAT family N-acetyltransferase [Pyrinomonadaceae bacterium]
MMEIREINPAEHEFLRDMLYEAIYFADEDQKLPKSIVFEPHLSKYVDNFGRKGDYAFVLADKNELTGAVWSRLFAESEKSYGFVDEKTPELSIAVKENYRNKGFGRILIAKLLETLKTDGFEKVSLSVDGRNRAVNLYRKMDFEIISKHGTALTMVKKINKI